MTAEDTFRAFDADERLDSKLMPISRTILKPDEACFYEVE